MTLPTYFRSAAGDIFRLLPDGLGEALIDYQAGLPSYWTDPTFGAGTFSDPSYTYAASQAPTYATLKDSDGNTWYLYAETVADAEGELVISDTVPTQPTGVFNETLLSSIVVTPSEGTTIHYLALEDEDGNSWYIYPDEFGELIITDVEPS